MPAQAIFLVVPKKPPVVTPGDIEPIVFANRSVVVSAIIIADKTISPLVVTNASSVPDASIDTTPTLEIDPPAISNSSSVNGATINAAPPDIALYPSTVINVSSVVAEVDVAPIDKTLRPSIVINSSSVDGAIIDIVPTGGVEDGFDPMIGEMLGDRMI